MSKIDELVNDWSEYVDFRNAYFFGEMEISLDDFAKLAKETFEVIKSAKEDHIYKGTIPEDPFDTLDYLNLISLISQYMIYDNAEDESENRVFTVTCLVALGLRDFAIGIDVIEHSADGKMTHYLKEETSSGTLLICMDDFPCFEDQDTEDVKMFYKYNVYDADFSELFEMAYML